MYRCSFLSHDQCELVFFSGYNKPLTSMGQVPYNTRILVAIQVPSGHPPVERWQGEGKSSAIQSDDELTGPGAWRWDGQKYRPKYVTWPMFPPCDRQGSMMVHKLPPTFPKKNEILVDK